MTNGTDYAEGVANRTRLTAMRVAELQELAASLGIAGASKRRKGELVELISAHTDGAGTAELDDAVDAGTATDQGTIEVPLIEQAAAEQEDAEKFLVFGSGNLGLIYVAGESRRLTLDDLTGRFPALVPGLVAHPGIAFAVVDTVEHGPVVLGTEGEHRVRDGVVVGEDPLAAFGPEAPGFVLRAAQMPEAPDIYVNSLLDELGEVARALGSRPTGLLRLAVPPGVVSVLLEPLIASFCQAYPEIEVEIAASGELIDLVAQGFDAGIRMGQFIAADMIALRLTPAFPFVVVGSPEYLVKRKSPERIDDLRQHACMRMRHAGNR